MAYRAWWYYPYSARTAPPVGQLTDERREGMTRGNRGINGTIKARCEVAHSTGRRWRLANEVGVRPPARNSADFRPWLGPVERDALDHLLPATYQVHFARGVNEAAAELGKDA